LTKLYTWTILYISKAKRRKEMKKQQYNMSAMREIERASRILCMTTGKGEEKVFENTINNIMLKYGAKKEVAMTYKNGLKKIQILDNQGRICGE